MGKSNGTKSNIAAFKCQYCRLAFTFKSNCSRHEKNCSVNPDEQDSSNNCPNCQSVFSRPYLLKKHLTKCTILLPTLSCSKKKTPCLLKGCDQEFYHKTSLIEHLQSQHYNDVTMKPLVVKKFSTIQEFNDWKEKEEERTNSYYTRKKGETEKSAVKHFYCQHDGSFKTHS
ncbi:Transcriptional regulator MET32 [Frankliniella fusca]|uniref:Transcriptional regulator MET32 n=1 Tax=Frankliniella fusca TaxID=407009 RepID=A0AAE1LJM8_9NEOP|nr:Transcriptional regulator MET32 [Frankliniella fusca]